MLGGGIGVTGSDGNVQVNRVQVRRAQQRRIIKHVLTALRAVLKTFSRVLHGSQTSLCLFNVLTSQTHVHMFNCFMSP